MGVARRNYWNYYPSLVQNRSLLSLGKCGNTVSSPKHTRDTDWGWGRITVPIVNLAMHKKQQQATDKKSKSVDKDSVLGTAESWDWDIDTKRNPKTGGIWNLHYIKDGNCYHISQTYLNHVLDLQLPTLMSWQRIGVPIIGDKYSTSVSIIHLHLMSRT